MGVNGIKALSEILPSSTQICAVGGLGDGDFKTYLKAGLLVLVWGHRSISQECKLMTCMQKHFRKLLNLLSSYCAASWLVMLYCEDHAI